ncbi:MAG TPA: preprotein translocase subunit SecE [Acidimicrobiales bacterium]|nr:preprotein translocase subunit SecE [Acidimicrobiales bacterium]
MTDDSAFVPSFAPTPRAVSPQLSIPGRVVEFVREIRSELRQVAWPTRSEVANSATVVFIVLVLMVCLIFLLTWTFSHGIIRLLST